MKTFWEEKRRVTHWSVWSLAVGRCISTRTWCLINWWSRCMWTYRCIMYVQQSARSLVNQGEMSTNCVAGRHGGLWQTHNHVSSSYMSEILVLCCVCLALERSTTGWSFSSILLPLMFGGAAETWAPRCICMPFDFSSVLVVIKSSGGGGNSSVWSVQIVTGTTDTD